MDLIVESGPPYVEINEDPQENKLQTKERCLFLALNILLLVECVSILVGIIVVVSDDLGYKWDVLVLIFDAFLPFFKPTPLIVLLLLAGILLLGNGLYGNQFRQSCLVCYMNVFHIFPSVFYAGAVVYMLIDRVAIGEWIKELNLHFHSKIVYFGLLCSYLLTSLFHALAVTLLHRYSIVKMQLQKGFLQIQ